MCLYSCIICTFFLGKFSNRVQDSSLVYFGVPPFVRLCSFREVPDHPAKHHSLVFIPLHTTSITLFHKPIYSYSCHTLHRLCPVWEIHICYYPTDTDVVVHTSFLIDRFSTHSPSVVVYPLYCGSQLNIAPRMNSKPFNADMLQQMQTMINLCDVTSFQECGHYNLQ